MPPEIFLQNLLTRRGQCAIITMYIKLYIIDVTLNR